MTGLDPSSDLALDLSLDGPELTRVLCDTESVSGDEARLADAVEAALGGRAHLAVDRSGNTVVARTSLGRAERVVVAGHIDTVPVAGNLPCRVEPGRIHGCGTTDMKGGVAVALRLAASLAAPNRDVSWVFYDCEEVESDRNGLGRVAREHPEWIAGDFAVLMEPSNGTVEGGCQGTMRVDVRLSGRRSHSARAWMGVNAIHAAAPVLSLLAAYEPETVEIDGLTYREGLNAVGISGGVAGNVLPDECVVSVNYRFAPSRSEAAAEAVVRGLFDGYQVTVSDSAPGALPGLAQPAASAFVAAIGRPPQPKFGWTDVSRFSALGVPAVNYGPGDPSLAHRADEYVDTAQIIEVEDRMRAWLTA